MKLEVGWPAQRTLPQFSHFDIHNNLLGASERECSRTSVRLGRSRWSPGTCVLNPLPGWFSLRRSWGLHSQQPHFSYPFSSGMGLWNSGDRHGGQHSEPRTCAGRSLSSLGLQYQMSQSGQHQQQKHTFLHLWRLDVRDRGMGRPGFCWGLSPRLTDGCLLGGSSPGPPLPWCLCVPIASSSKGTSQVGLGPTKWPHFNLITSVKVQSPNTVTIWGPVGQSLSVWIWRRGLGSIVQPMEKDQAEVADGRTVTYYSKSLTAP